MDLSSEVFEFPSSRDRSILSDIEQRSFAGSLMNDAVSLSDTTHIQKRKQQSTWITILSDIIVVMQFFSVTTSCRDLGILSLLL